MQTRVSIRLLGGVLTAILWTAPLRAQDDAFFERKIRPILAGTCFKCHGGERISAKLRVDSRPALLQGGRSGPAVVPGDPDRSLLVRVLRPAKDKDTPHMPPGKELPAEVAADFASWIKQGAPWPATTTAKAFAAAKHWAFQPLHDAPPPDFAEFAHPIDRFLADGWKGAGSRRSAWPNGVH